MKCLLDTHAFLWAALAPSQLSRRAKAVIEDTRNLVGVSTVTFWEISLKFALGKLELEGVLPDELPAVAAQMDMTIEPLAVEDAATYHRLTRAVHKDPFDRMIVWQSLRRQWSLISADRQLDAYRALGLELLW
jgi:PIN domain nuclease of toxin-antitoxin system